METENTFQETVILHNNDWRYLPKIDKDTHMDIDFYQLNLILQLNPYW